MTGRDFFRVEDSYFPQKRTLNLRGKLFTFDRPIVMGILNSTPDSFFSGSRAGTISAALKTAEKMLAEGADIIDVGGYSTRPGAEDISEKTEQERVAPVIAAISWEFPQALLSIDTFRSEVARAAVNSGAHILNDISGGSLDAQMFQTAGELGCPYILMHMRGTPQTMKGLTDYDNLFRDISRYFSEKILELQSFGVKDIILDPGFGFAKTIEQNYELLEKFDQFQLFGLPLLAGLSRKSMIWKKLGIEPEEALNGTTALNTVALLKGASIVRVHDVKEARQVISLLCR